MSREPCPLTHNAARCQRDELRAEIERLRTRLNETDHQLTAVEHINAREKIELRAEIERLRALVEAALRGLHNDFEPDNQSALYNRIKTALDPKP